MLDEKQYRKGVGIILLNQDKKLFVGKRIDQTSEAWQMPQGGIDAGETPQQALMRELKEEVGTDKASILHEIPEWLHYDLPDYLARKLWGGRYKGQLQKWFVLNFDGTDADINIKTHIPEFMEWQWIKPHQAPDLIVDFKRDLYQRIIAKIPSHFI